MRNILSKTDEERKSKRNKAILGILLLVIMLFSVLGYAFYSVDSEEVSAGEVNYRGVDFVQDGNGYWVFQIDKYSFSTKYNPLDTENISVPALALQDYVNSPLYFSGGSFGIREIGANLAEFTERMQEACIDECEGNLPIKNCSKDRVIVFVEENLTYVEKQGNCTFIFSPKKEELRASDAVLFKLLGIQ